MPGMLKRCYPRCYPRKLPNPATRSLYSGSTVKIAPTPLLDELRVREVIDRDHAQLLAGANRDHVADRPGRNGCHEHRGIGRLTVREAKQVLEHGRRYRARAAASRWPRGPWVRSRARTYGWVASGPSARAAKKGVSYIRGGARVARGVCGNPLQRRAALGREGGAALALAPW